MPACTVVACRKCKHVSRSFDSFFAACAYFDSFAKCSNVEQMKDNYAAFIKTEAIMAIVLETQFAELEAQLVLAKRMPQKCELITRFSIDKAGGWDE
jgi:hypothetical protein